MQRTKLAFTIAIAAIAFPMALLGTIAPAVASSTLTVTKTADTNDGVCNSDCSLREAIAAASPGDTINIPGGTYTLTLGSELNIAKDLTLAGAGTDSTIIQAATEPGVATWRVFSIPEFSTTSRCQTSPSGTGTRVLLAALAAFPSVEAFLVLTAH